MENASVCIPQEQWHTEEFVIRPLSSADIQNVRALYVCSSHLHPPLCQANDLDIGGVSAFLPRITPDVLPPASHAPNAPLLARDLAIFRQARRLHRHVPPRPYLRPDLGRAPALRRSARARARRAPRLPPAGSSNAPGPHRRSLAARPRCKGAAVAHRAEHRAVPGARLRGCRARRWKRQGVLESCGDARRGDPCAT